MDKTLVFGLPKNSKVVSIVRTDTCMYDTCMTPLRQKPRPAEAFEAPGKPFAWHRSENEMHPSQLGVRQNSSGTALILTFSPREKEQQAHGSGFANEHPANPVACFCGATADDSPSPICLASLRKRDAPFAIRCETEFFGDRPHPNLLPQGEGTAGARFWFCEWASGKSGRVLLR